MLFRRFLLVARTGLQRLGLVGPAYRAYERWQSWWSARRRPTPSHGPDGLPFPPQRLVVLVAGPASPENFLRMGRMGADLVRSMVESDGARLEDMSAILDFGVGCGRVARHWKTLEGPSIHGCDINGDLAAWTDGNLPFAEARQNALEPPLPYEDATFDLVYAFSGSPTCRRNCSGGGSPKSSAFCVPTDGCCSRHTALHTWIASMRGNGEHLMKDDSSFSSGSWQGANICNAFHPESYVRETLADGFEGRFAPREAHSTVSRTRGCCDGPVSPAEPDLAV